MSEIYGSDAYAPAEIAQRVENAGVAKANLPLLPMAALGVLAGGFIGLGACFYTAVAGDPAWSFATTRLVGGLVFSMGLALVVVAGAELFTGNNLMVMALVARRITPGRFLRNLAVVYAANLVGALGLAQLVAWSGVWKMGGGSVGKAAVAIAAAKVALPFGEAFFRGVLCNVLVCLAVWLAMAGRSATDKILAVMLPIAAFVACGFEHCVANMYFVPAGLFLKETCAPAAGAEGLDWGSFAASLIPVTLGNLVGGTLMVGAVFVVVYRRPAPPKA